MQIRPVPVGPLRPAAFGIHPHQQQSVSMTSVPQGYHARAAQIDRQSMEKEQQVDWARRQHLNKDVHQVSMQPPTHQELSAGYNRYPEVQTSLAGATRGQESQAAMRVASCSPERQAPMVSSNCRPEFHTPVTTPVVSAACAAGVEQHAPMANANCSPELQASIVTASSNSQPQAKSNSQCKPGSGRTAGASKGSSNRVPVPGSATFPWLLPRLETAIEVRTRFKDAEDSPSRHADIKELQTLKNFAVAAAVKGDGTDHSKFAMRDLQDLFLKLDNWLDSFCTSHVSVPIARQRLWFGTHLQYAIWVSWDAAARAAGQCRPDSALKKPAPAPIYAVDEFVEYWSSTHKEWTTTKVKKVHPDGSTFDLANRNNAVMERIYPATDAKVKDDRLMQAVSAKYEILNKIMPQEKCEPARPPQDAPCFSSHCRKVPASPPEPPSFQQAEYGFKEHNAVPVRIWPSECLTSRPQGHMASMQNLRGPTSRLESGAVDMSPNHASSMQNLRSPTGRSGSGGRVSGGRLPGKKETGAHQERVPRSSGGSDPGSSRARKYDSIGLRADRSRFPLSYDHGSEGSTQTGRSSIGSCSGTGTAWESTHGSINVTGRSSTGSVTRHGIGTRQSSKTMGKKTSRGSSSPPAPLSSPSDVFALSQRPRRSSDGIEKNAQSKSSGTRCAAASQDEKDSPLSEMKRIHKRMEDFLWQCGVDPNAPIGSSKKESEKTTATSPQPGVNASTTWEVNPMVPTNSSSAVVAAVEAAATAAAKAAKVGAFFAPAGGRPKRTTPEVHKPCVERNEAPTPCFERQAPSSALKTCGDLDAIDAKIKAMIGKGNHTARDDQKENQQFNYVPSCGGA